MAVSDIITDLNIRGDTQAINFKNIKEALEGSFNVKSYGAVGDGVTDDTAAIAAAVAAGAGGAIYFPAGNYLTDEIVLPANTSLFGAGPGSSVLFANSDSQTLVSTTNGSPLAFYTRILHLGFSANAHSAVTGISCTLTYYPYFEDLNFYATALSIVLTRVNFFTIKDILVQGSSAWGLAGPQLSIGAASPFYSQNGTIINYQYLGIGGVSNPTQTILLRRATNVDIVSYQSNDLLASARAITIDGDCQGISIIGGQITHPNNGIVVNDNGGDTPSAINIVGVQIDQASALGILFQTGSLLSASNNQIYSATNAGIYVGTGNAKICGNLIHSSINGIEVASTGQNTLISGNTFDAISNVAILLDGSNTNTIIGPNIFSNGVAAELSGTPSDYVALSNIGAPSVRGTAVAFADLPAVPVEGMLVGVTDSNTTTWGANIAGSSTNHVLAYYNGSHWTVAGK